MLFSQYNQALCGTEIPQVLGLFDFSTAPKLLFYSYIPIALISLIIGLLVYKKDNHSLKSRMLLAMTGFFFLWVINILVQWVASYHSVLMFAWQLTALFEVGLFLSAFCLAYVFVYKRNLTRAGQYIVVGIWTLTACLIPSTVNVAAYDVVNCEGVVGPLWNIIYGLEAASIVLIGMLGVHAYHKETSFMYRKQIKLFAMGIVALLATFFLSNFYGELTGVYEFNLWGPVGMLAFFILLGYLMVKFRTFNIKLFGTQALVLLITILIGARFFYNANTTDLVLSSVTLIFFVISGYFLVRSVRIEVQQKENLQKLSMRLEQTNLDLEVANTKLKSLDKLKTEFLSLASHQLRSPLTAIKGYASMLIEGSFGKLAVKTTEPIQRIYTSAQGLSNIVEDLLNVSKIEQGGMKYEFMPTKVADIVQTLYGEMQIPAQSKQINLTLSVAHGDDFAATADPTKLKQVFLNLVDNSIKYTPEGGTVAISLSRIGKEQIVFAVKDTGMGISPETKDKLFEKFSRGEGGKVNTGGSGLGLYLAKQIAIAHKGDITIESEGLGKGATFTVRLPAMAS